MKEDRDADIPIDVRQFGMSPLSLRQWHGMAAGVWFAKMRGKWHLVSPRRYPLVVTITLFSLANQVMKWASKLIFGRQLAKVKIEPDPIFVIGHWRSGTTWLHRIMMLDKRHAAPDFGACFCPETFLIARKILTPLLRVIMPSKRPMDNVELELESAEEDEHAISLSGGVTPYADSMFPNQKIHTPICPDDMTPEDAATWWDTWLAFLRKVQFVNPGKRLVLKSPTHTMRTREILRTFPNARFVHIVRDPYKIFLSRQKARRAMLSLSALQTTLPSPAKLDADLISRFRSFHDKFHEDREHIPENQIFTMRYEDLKSDTVAIVEQIYKELDLGDFSAVRPKLEQMVGSARPYENNRYDMDPDTQARIETEFADYFKKYDYLHMNERPETPA